MHKATQRVRNFRKSPTAAEAVLWEEIRNNKLGQKIVRQKPILFDYLACKRMFVADFYCKSAQLIIEVDGGVHETQIDYDLLRTGLMKQMGFRIIRFTNEEVLLSIDAVLATIQKSLIAQ